MYAFHLYKSYLFTFLKGNAGEEFLGNKEAVVKYLEFIDVFILKILEIAVTVSKKDHLISEHSSMSSYS